MCYYFYIVRCSDNSLYCGQTSNLQKRIRVHNTSSKRGAKYTKIRRPVELVYFEEYPELSMAMKREWQVKKWTRAKKEVLIKGDMSLLKNL